jgi:ribonuclease HI
MVKLSDNALAMEELADKLGVSDYDLMLVGDGSGSSLLTPCGWYVTAYERKTGKVWSHNGGASGGTNNYAELEPFIFALWAYRHVLWHYHTEQNGNDGKMKVTPPKVLIVSDSEVTVKGGTREYSRRANAPLWASIEWFEQKNYVIHWRWVPRNSNKFNLLADKVAGETRKAVRDALTE